LADSVHPAARLLAWCGWAVAVEIAAPSRLAILAVAAATAFLFPFIRPHAGRLLRRTRWLLFILFVAYALTLPGAPLWPAAGWASPTLEGVQGGALRVARLVLMLLGLAVLLATTARPRLIYGLYVLARPLAWLGFDRRAFAVRLGLTLDYVDRDAQTPKRAHWLDALAALPDEAEPARFVLEAERWQTRDSAVILAAVLLLGFAWA
jgi:energy-coupling factor transporter transmembrane protein EcfT